MATTRSLPPRSWRDCRQRQPKELQCWNGNIGSPCFTRGFTWGFARGFAGRLAPAPATLPPNELSAAVDCARPVPARSPLEYALIAAAQPLLVVILGPTGSGKTALSLALARGLGGEIVNCDSVATYREFEIGTAKPTAEERLRAPHHLFDYIEPTSYITAGEYARQGRAVLEQIRARQNVPIVVGGTGLYLRALLVGLFPGPQRSLPLRERLQSLEVARGSIYLHRILRRLDREAAASIHANDTPKLIRALEVCLASGRKMSELWKGGSEPLRGFRIVRLGLNPQRPALYQRINQRAEHMFSLGLVEETRSLLEKYGDQAGPLHSIGYKQALELIRGHLDRPAALQRVQQAQRNYAKRQLTWFRRDAQVSWLDGFGDDPRIQKAALARTDAN
jgi:tRNA dimethylallyltransferase